MKKGLRKDTRKQKELIKFQMANKLNKIPFLAGLAYRLSEKSKDVTINNIENYLTNMNVSEELDDLDKALVISEYNRIITDNEQRD